MCQDHPGPPLLLLLLLPRCCGWSSPGFAQVCCALEPSHLNEPLVYQWPTFNCHDTVQINYEKMAWKLRKKTNKNKRPLPPSLAPVSTAGPEPHTSSSKCQHLWELQIAGHCWPQTAQCEFQIPCAQPDRNRIHHELQMPLPSMNLQIAVGTAGPGQFTAS